MTDAARHWGDAEHTAQLARVSWMASPAVQLHLNERSTGNPAYDWITGWAKSFFAGSNLNILVLGCGEGWLERAIAADPQIAHIDALDFAADAVERARAAAREIPKIDYAVADLNRDALHADRYDVVIAHSVLHHVENLEYAFGEIEQSMKRDAALVINEYVGPRRFQYGDDVLDIVNRLLACLPSRRREGAVEKKTYESKARPTIDEMIASDPSEAVRSDDILPLVRERFTVIDERPLGGTILQHLLYDVVQNFDFEKPKERAMIEILCMFEAALIDACAIPCDFTIAAARRKDSLIPQHARSPLSLPTISPDLFDRDPLGFGPRTTSGPRRASGELPDWVLRLLRSALLATRDKRRPLVANSRIRESIERARCRWSGSSPIAWTTARFSAVADPSNEDDTAILRLIEAIGRISAEEIFPA